MQEIKIPIPESFQEDLRTMMRETAREALAEAKEQERHGKDFMSLKDCCQYLGISYGTLNVWIRQLGLKTIVIQGKTFIAKQTLLEFLKQHEN